MEDAVFWITTAAIGILDVMLFATLLIPSVRLWPPPSRWSWSYWITWTLFGVLLAGILWLGVLNSGSLGDDYPSRNLIGSLLIVGGTVLILWGIGTVGLHGTFGLEDELVTSGPYRFSRNPQYVGDLFLLAGYFVICNSILVGVVAVLASLWFVLLPFAEEPWLEETYGDEYVAYKNQHARFVGLPHKG